MVNQLDWYFWIYKRIYDPPGTPKHKKCVTCKLALASVAGVIAPLSLYGIYRYRRSNVMLPIFGFTALVSTGAAFLSLKVALDNYQDNLKLTQDYKREVTKQRRERSSLELQGA